MKHHFASKNIVAKSILAPADAPLPFAQFHASQLFNRMPSTAPVRILREDSNQLLQGIEQFDVFLGQFSKFTFKRWRSDYPKRAVHLRGLLFPTGRFLPQLCKKSSGFPLLPTPILLAALANLRFETRFLHFQIVFEF